MIINEEASEDTQSFYDLSLFSSSDYRAGRGYIVRTLWYYCSLLFFESGWLPISRLKATILRWFGSSIGEGLVIKPHVRIKYPWRLRIGNHCWIGQGAWIDNIEDVFIGDHVCISQLVYFCTGSHNHLKSTFDLTAKPITVQNGAWVGARALLLGGVEVGANAVVASGSLVTKNVAVGTIVGGCPARFIGKR